MAKFLTISDIPNPGQQLHRNTCGIFCWPSSGLKRFYAALREKGYNHVEIMWFLGRRPEAPRGRALRATYVSSKRTAKAREGK